MTSALLLLSKAFLEMLIGKSLLALLLLLPLQPLPLVPQQQPGMLPEVMTGPLQVLELASGVLLRPSQAPSNGNFDMAKKESVLHQVVCSRVTLDEY